MTANDSLPLPSLAQCESLTDEQCRRIMDFQDPEGIRAQKGWEPTHQPELIRQYMTMRSFTQIAERMKSKVDWSYKTYSNRYKDWLFPVDRNEREIAVKRLYACLMSENESLNIEYNRSAHESLFAAQTRRPQRCLGSQDDHDLMPELLNPFSPTESMSTTGYGSDTICDEVYEEIASSFVSPNIWIPMHTFNETTNIVLPILNPTVTAGPMSQFSNRSLPYGQDLGLGSVKHDPKNGLWNSTLHVIPCHKDHSSESWKKLFAPCMVCGFSQCHALMINARSIDIDTFRESVSLLRDSTRPDCAGNHPIAFLMTAGVGMEYFKAVLWDVQWSAFGQNSFSQSPLHVLNPQNLGDDLVDLLKLCSHGLSLRDQMCRTLLHYLFLHPLKRGSYLRVLQNFPNAAYHLQAFDTSGKRITQIMQEAAESINASFKHFRGAILVGLQEIERFISSSQTNNVNIQPYSYTDIARGVCVNAGDSFFSSNYECRFCRKHTHSKSHYDQMMCACNNGGMDRNAPDERGWTAAHLLVTHVRCSNDSNMMYETPEETEKLFRLLIFNSNLREALHVRDPYGNSLVYNIATRGHSGILKYVLELEDEGRRYSMVNFVGTTMLGQKRSVLESVEIAIADCKWNLDNQNFNTPEEKNRLNKLRYSFDECKRILDQWGAELKPSVEKQWRIY